MKGGWLALPIAVVAGLTWTAARADYEGRMIGNWIVSAKEDRFGEGGTYIALTAGEGMIFAVRCIEKELSLGVSFRDRDIKPRDLFDFKFRVDRNPVEERTGIAISERLIQIGITGTFIQQMQRGKELAVRMETRTAASTYIVKLRGSSRAFSDIVNACPPEKVRPADSQSPEKSEDKQSVAAPASDAAEIQTRTITVPNGALSASSPKKD